MTPEERQECAELRKELMALQADYKDLLDKLMKWSKHFYEFYKLIDKVNDEENQNGIRSEKRSGTG